MDRASMSIRNHPFPGEIDRCLKSGVVSMSMDSLIWQALVFAVTPARVNMLEANTQV
jgi:hypothetical protein